MNGGKREGAGRPPAPARPTPISWRPDTQAQRDKYIELGGARWVKRVLDDVQKATCRADGRCQYAIDHGAEGLGHCPKGKCAQPTDVESVERQKAAFTEGFSFGVNSGMEECRPMGGKAESLESCWEDSNTLANIMPNA